MAQIKVIIHKDGKIELEGLDFKGNECHKILEELCKNLGKMTDVKEKPEFYEEKVVISNQEKVGS